MTNVKTKKNVPELRFKEFDGEWSPYLIGELCNLMVDCVNKTAPTIDEPTEFKMIRTSNVRNGVLLLDETRYVDEETFNIWNRRCVPTKGDLIFTREAPVGEMGLITTNHKLMLGQRTYLYRFNDEKANNIFILNGFQTRNQKNQIESMSHGATVSHMKVPDCEKIKFNIPSLPEQKKIADFLSAVDQKIQLLQKKKEKLELYKKGLMQKLFPAAPGLVPELRFKDDEGNDFPVWEEKRLGDFCEVKAGGDIGKLNYSKQMTDIHIYPIYANALTNNGLFGYSDSFDVNQDCVTVTGRGLVGYAQNRNERFTAVVRLLVLFPLEKTSTYFLKTSINLINIFVETTGVPQLTSPQLKRYQIRLPCYKEQIKIQDFLYGIDEKNDSVSKQIKMTKELKNGLLQRMFI